MINDGVNDVPEKTIALFIEDFAEGFTSDRITNIIKPASKTRDWFTPHFYRCLPLVIGNTYGFVIHTEVGFSVEWNGGQEAKDLSIIFDENPQGLFPDIKSHFGFGTFTVGAPFSLRTPFGVNLMTINPPNVIIPNITVMTGVIEADNLRRNFGITMAVQVPNISIHFPKGIALAGVLPIPRYFADTFALTEASKLFAPSIVREEQQACLDAVTFRNTEEQQMPNKVGRHYYRGQDVYGNKFLDHQN